MTIDINALPGSYSKRSRINSYLQVLNALMLRDMRNRFGATYWGWGIAVLWPVTHMAILAGIMVFRGLPTPMSVSPELFAATGAIPVLAFQYISREIMKGILNNRPLTYYPHVKTLDVVLARVVVEIVGSFLGVIVLLSVLISMGNDPTPVDMMQSVGGYLAAILLGIGVGSINVSMVVIFPGWMMGYLLFSIMLYILSGIFYMPVFLPEYLYTLMKWNPLVQIVEWVRLGYDPTLPIEVDYLYVLLWCGCTLAVGLALERYVMRDAGAA